MPIQTGHTAPPRVTRAYRIDVVLRITSTLYVLCPNFKAL